MAWDRVSASTITNCFAYCGVVESTVATSQASEDIENWDQLGIECSADDDLVTCGLRTVEEMGHPRAILGGPELSWDSAQDGCEKLHQSSGTSQFTWLTLAVLLDDVLLEPDNSVEESSDLCCQESPKEYILEYLAGYIAKSSHR
ncbi:hypothetical protein HPB49_020803 [Dermacentor silvarum]|uniref:Uncharacterized protein n=1 Tax=Dermacentor silvarum TaxID=543639 RepID=A0ACB8DK69_DERSI|nr:hypothetical protein HPB49_020803 [Dermacentor silvarum]